MEGQNRHRYPFLDAWARGIVVGKCDDGVVKSNSLDQYARQLAYPVTLPTCSSPFSLVRKCSVRICRHY